MNVAIIGAGAAGLAAARQCHRAGFSCQVFEQSGRVGGIWVYEPRTEDDPLGLAPTQPVFSSLYDSLRTNLPRDLMAFADYTFDSAGGGSDDDLRFPHHPAVLEYLERFTRDHNLAASIRLNAEVSAICPDGKGWQVTTRDGETGRYDAVLVCNGHYSRPRVPHLEGIEKFQGNLLHAHNYRNKSPFAGQRVALWGTAASGADLSREIAQVAETVYWCGHLFADIAPAVQDGITLSHPPAAFTGANTLQLESGQTVEIDTFIYCTGYEYQFPFLPDGIISVDDNRIFPLYLDIVPPTHPTLGFIGIPYLVVPFPLFDLQARWFTGLLKGDVALPNAESLDVYFARRDEVDLPRHYHRLGDAQADYMAQLAADCGAEAPPEWFHKLAKAAQEARMVDPKGFREKDFPAFGPTVVRSAI